MRDREVETALSKIFKSITEKCVECGLCGKECGFLREYGSPKRITDGFDISNERHRTMAYACNLCNLCTAVCPNGLDPAAMFLEMRREAVHRGMGDHPEHKGVLAHERRGTSKRYSWYGLPENCDTVFFPGCALSGTRPQRTLAFHQYLKQHIPTAGIVLDCCAKPSHDLGRQRYFQTMFDEMKSFLLTNNVKKILVACPGCYKVFKEYAGEMSVTTVYEFMVNDGIGSRTKTGETITVHDPCVLRFEEAVQLAVRRLLIRQGLTVQEMRHNRKKTLCCGEGGSAGCLAPDFSTDWGNLRKKEANGNRIFTYCAGCASKLHPLMPTGHLMDLMFEPEKTLAGKTRVSQPPMTYLNRLWLKHRMKKTVDASVSRERGFTAEV